VHHTNPTGFPRVPSWAVVGNISNTELNQKVIADAFQNIQLKGIVER